MNNTNPTETCHKLGQTQMLQEGNQFLLNYVVFFYIKFKLKMAINENHSSRLGNIYIYKKYFQKLWNQNDMSQTVNLLRERQHVNRAKNRI